MATAYDAPNVTVRRAASFLTVAGNGTVGARSVSYQKRFLRGIHVEVVTAGTSTTNTLTFHVAGTMGTTSVSSVALSTSAAGLTTSITGLSQSVTSLQKITTTNGTDATGVALITYEWDVAPEANQS